MEEEDEFEVLGNLLECGANRGDGDELGDVEQDRNEYDRGNMEEEDHFGAMSVCSLLKITCHFLSNELIHT